MLEAIAACSEPNLSLSQNVRRRARYTRRLLHAAFWTHGAACLNRVPAVLGLQRPGRSPRASAKSHGEHEPKTALPLLDFLYPVKALAALYRSSTSSRPSWNQRVVTGVSYSSLPRTSASRDIRVVQLRSYASHSPLDALSVSEEQLRVKSTEAYRQARKEASQKSHRIAAWKKGRKEFRKRIAANQKKLAATQNGSLIEQPDRLEQYLKNLKAILSRRERPGPPLYKVKRLWGFVDLNDKSDVVLRRDLFLWLASRKGHGARAATWDMAIDLLSQIPEENRDALVYRYGVQVYHAMSNPGMAQSLIEQAMSRQVSGDIGVNILLRHFLRNADFRGALSLYRRALTHANEIGENPSLELIFQGIEGFGWTDSWLPKLMRYVDMNCEKTSGQGEFVGTTDYGTPYYLLKNVLNRLPVWIADSPNVRIRKGRAIQMQRMVDLLLDRPYADTLYRSIILSLLDHNKTFTKTTFSALIDHVWKAVIRIPGAGPGRQVMYRLTKAWKEHRICNPLVLDRPEDTLQANDVRVVWEKRHGRLSYATRLNLMQIAAERGEINEVDSLAEDYFDGSESDPDPNILWPYISVRAKRRDAKGAQAAFDSIPSKFGVRPTARCWDLLLHAYDHSDDLDGALDCFQRMGESSVRYSAYSIMSLLNLYAKIGTPEAIKELLNFARTQKIPFDTHMMNALVVAYGTTDEPDMAMQVGEKTRKMVEAGQVKGDLSIVHNSLLTMHAHRKDLLSTLKLFRQMQERRMKLDEQSYAAVVAAYCLMKQPHVAWKLIKEVMPAVGFVPDGFHYTSVMLGFIMSHDFRSALNVYAKMRLAGIKPTVETKVAYLRAKGEHEQLGRRRSNGRSSVLDKRPLERTIRALLDALGGDTTATSDDEPGDPLELKMRLVVKTIEIHGRQKSFDAVWQLYQTASHFAPEGEESPPFQLVKALMSVYHDAGDHPQVERCWNLLMEQAQRLRVFRFPDPIDPAPFDSTILDKIADIPDRGEGNWILDDEGRKVSTFPAPRYRDILATPIRIYYQSVTAVDLVPARAITRFTSLLLSLMEQDYVLDNMAWNVIIERLCTMSPPRTLLAYTLTERFLIPNFQGWDYRRGMVPNDIQRPHKGEATSLYQYMRYDWRYHPKTEYRPFYRTMVVLAHAAQKMPQIQAVGGLRDLEDRELALQVGTVEDVKIRAPRTVRAVMDLPVVADELQNRYLRVDGEDDGKWGVLYYRLRRAFRVERLA